MANGRFAAICKNCGKKGTVVSGTVQGAMPSTMPTISGKCPAHPSGNPNMPHVPQWVKI